MKRVSFETGDQWLQDGGAGDDFVAMARHEPTERLVRKQHTFSHLMDGFNTLLFFWAGQDRSTVLAQCTAQVNDPEVNIDGSCVCNTEDYAGILLVLRHTNPDFETRRRRLLELQAKLDAFASQCIEGKQIKVEDTVKLAVSMLDRPGELRQLTDLLAARGINLARLDTERWFPSAEQKLHTVLMFMMEMPTDSPEFLLQLRHDIEALAPDFKTGVDEEADAMFKQATSFSFKIKPNYPFPTRS